MNLSEGVSRMLDFLRFRRRDYQLAFGGPAGQAVLRDLLVFCRARETCYLDDERKTLVLIGRNEVWLRIANHLHLTSEQLFALYNGRTITLEGDNDGQE